MTVHVVSHRDCLAHEAGAAHPERADRLRVVLEVIDDSDRWKGQLHRHDALPVGAEALLRVHPRSYLSLLEETSARGGGRLDPDTAVNRASWRAARLAAGAAVQAAEIALAGEGNAFAAVRPPGHHALASRAMGFCLLNNVVIAAHAARAVGAERVLIVDWDVHHGNGTQALVEGDAGFHFVSLHQWPWYPGTGRAEERGVGNVWNVPRAPGLARHEYVAALVDAIDQATRAWRPRLVLVSAGFDSMAGDPLGGFTLEPDDYVTVLDRLAAEPAPVVAVLEGGYALHNLVAGVSAVLTALA